MAAQTAPVNSLVGMGFAESSARQALHRFGGNVQRAADYLLSAASSSSNAPSAAPHSNNLAASISKVQQTHPSVQVPPTMQQKSKQERIFRCTNRLEKHPNAVDTLYKTIQRVRQNPKDRKYWTIDCSLPAVQKLVATPGAMDFLTAMNYQMIQRNSLQLQFYDAATMYMGTLALGQCQMESRVYREAKRSLQFAKEIRTIFSDATSPQERAARASHLQQVPTLSAHNGGLGSPIFVYFDGVDEDPLPNRSTKYLTRNFDGDDTLQDVLHWVASQASVAWEHLVLNGQWQLLDKNQRNAKPLYLSDNRNDRGHADQHADDGTNALHQTLQHLGFWPSGKLVIRPAAVPTSQSPFVARPVGGTAMVSVKA